MAKFSFRLQSVLNLKIRLEDQQRNTFVQARRRLEEEKERLLELEGRLSDYEEEGRKKRENTLFIRDILENEEAIIRVKEYIENQNATIQIYENKLEEERKKLVEMIQERKTYEKLREKAFEQYMEEEKHSEGVANDEHNSYVYGVKEV